MNNQLYQHFSEARQVLDRFMADESNFTKLEQAGNILVTAAENGKIIACGNGGSMADAMHFAEELTGRYRESRRPIAAMAVADPTHISCVSNDFGYDFVFSRHIEAFGQPGDVLLAISTSGNSPNILEAAETARRKEMKIIALTGKDGGKLAAMADVELRVPHQGFSDRIQEVHIKIIHTFIDYIEQHLD